MSRVNTLYLPGCPKNKNGGLAKLFFYAPVAIHGRMNEIKVHDLSYMHISCYLRLKIISVVCAF
jgi:hypothetical protein